MNKRNFSVSPVAFAIGLLCSQCAWSQNAQSTSVGTIEVVGQAESMTQNSIEAAKEKVKAIPGGASVVDLNQVREGRQSTWSDSLGLAPGVYIQDRFGSEEARLAIRGSGLSRTYHGFGTKVMQDGVPINYADGMFDMQTLDPNASRYVEVLRGPNATTYGATTLGGAVNFVSPTGYTSPSFVGKAEAGSFGYNKVFGSTAGVAKPSSPGGNVWDYYLAGSQTKQDGFRQHAEMENQKLLANFGVKVNRDVESRFYVAAVRSRTQLPGYLTKAELENTPNIRHSTGWDAGFYVNDNNQRRDVDAQRVANKTTVRDGNNVYEFAAYAMNYNLWHPIAYGVIQQNVDTQGGHFKVTNTSGANQVTFAYLPSTGTTKGTTHNANRSGLVTGNPNSDYTQESTNHTFFVEDKYRLTDKTSLVGAIQYDKANRKVSDVAPTATGRANNYNHDFSQWSPRVGVTHDLAPKQQIFASVSRNFEAPIHGLAGSTSVANKAQTGTTFEVGARGEAANEKSQYGWDATYYRANLKNEFLAVCPVADPTCAGTGGMAPTVNLAKSMHQGVELGVSHLYDRKLDSRMALLYSDFRFVGDQAYGNNALPGFPPVIVRGEVLYRFGSEVNGKPGAYIGPKFEWVPSKAPMDNANTVYNDRYTLVGFKAGQAIDKKWSWFADARNLTNKKYAATTNIAANLVGNSNGANYYPGDGRSVYVGVEAKFD